MYLTCSSLIMFLNVFNLLFFIRSKNEIGELVPITQLTFICSKSTIETLENMFKVNYKNTRTTSFWCFYCWLWTYFTLMSSISIVDFWQVNVSWEARQQISSFDPFWSLTLLIIIRKLYSRFPVYCRY